MKIAVTYDGGNVFQHFGHTEHFKIYDVVNNEVRSSEVIDTDGSGHEALATFLANQDVNVLICGGCGSGAADALMDAGIEVMSGAEGDADVAVATYLRGAMTSAGVNCDHHDHHHDEAGGCGGCSGGGCSGCSGGCASAMPAIEGPNVGKIVRVHYRGTFEDGTQFDSSYDRDEPLEFICGVGMMISGFDQACAGMKEGEIIDVTLPPEMAYGQSNPNAIFTFNISELPGSENLKVDDMVVLTNSLNQPVQAKVVAKDDSTVTFDTNNEMAGKTLNFKIEMVEIKEM